MILDEAAITRFRQNYRIEFGAAGTDDPLYEAVSAGRKHAGVEHWLPFFHDRLETLFDYLPGASVCAGRSGHAVAARRGGRRSQDQYETRHHAMSQKNRMDTVYKPCPPGLLYLDDAAWEGALGDRRVLQFHPLPQATGPGVIDAGGRIGRNFLARAPAGKYQPFRGGGRPCSREDRKVGHVVLAAYSEGAAERLEHLLEDHDIHGARHVERFADMNGKTGQRAVRLAAGNRVRNAGPDGDRGTGHPG